MLALRCAAMRWPCVQRTSAAAGPGPGRAPPSAVAPIFQKRAAPAAGAKAGGGGDGGDAGPSAPPKQPKAAAAKKGADKAHKVEGVGLGSLAAAAKHGDADISSLIKWKDGAPVPYTLLADTFEVRRGHACAWWYATRTCTRMAWRAQAQHKGSAVR